MKSEDKRVTAKLDPTNRDILKFAKRVTGKNFNEFLRDFLEPWILCASAYHEFTYQVNVHSPDSIEIMFFGKPAITTVSKKITSLEDVVELENEMIQKAYNEAEKTIVVQKGEDFDHVCKKISRAKTEKILKKVVD